MSTEPLKQQDLIIEIETTHRNFNKTLSRFSENELNTVPFEGSWTAGQVAEHIIKSNGGILNQMLDGKAKSINRPYDDQVKHIQEIFRSKDKMKTAPVLEPGKPPHNLDSLLENLKKQEEKQIKSIKEKNPEALIPELEFPPSPNGLTRYEWLHLMIEHANRHQKQIENIYKEVQV